MKAASDSQLGEEILRLVFELAERTRTHFDEVADGYGLTPTQAIVIMQLGEPIAMHELASALTCERSNITGLVDRLEKLDLVARQPGLRDRRVKTIVLTPAGSTLRAQLHERIYKDATPIKALNGPEKVNLADLLRKISGNADQDDTPRTCPTATT